MDAMVERIAKLLALGEAAGTPQEAEAAFAKAQQLASKHSIDVELARRASKPKERQTPIMRVIRVGEKGKHANAPLISLFSEIAAVNDVRILIAHNSTFVEAHGFPTDIDATEASWVSIALFMVKHADALVRDKNAAWRSETYMDWDNYEWTRVEKKVTGQGARKSFYRDFTFAIGRRLDQIRQESIKQADEQINEDINAHAGITAGDDAPNLPSSMALVVREKKAEIEDFMWDNYEKRYGKRKAGSWKGGGSSSGHSSSAAAAGREAAQRVNLGGSARGAIAS
jgi:Protein of unknown function (DUF2786)